MSVAGGAARGARSHDVVFVRLVSLEFLERCWEEDELKQLMAPRWSVEGADISPETVHETISQLARGNIGAAVDFFWHFLGLARLGVRETARQTDEHWRAQLRERGWPPPPQSYRVIDKPEFVDVIRKAHKNIDWGVLFAAQTHRGGGG
jgi:hypothetical protein